MIIAVLLFGAIFLLDLLRAVFVTRKVVELQKQKRILLETSAHLNSEAAKLTSPATFAQCAKLQRTAIFNEKQAEKISAEQALLRKLWLNKTISPLKLLICLAVTLSLWRQPIAYSDAVDAWPLARWLSGFTAQQHYPFSSVAAAPYLAVTQVVSHALVRVCVPDAWSS